MCGIFGGFGGGHCDRIVCIENAYKQVHRGPDDFYCQEVKGGYLCFTRLNVMDRSDLGRQPFVFQNFAGITNGEIYNSKSLENEFGIKPKGTSDCEMIPELFSKVGSKLPNKLDGMFALLIVDNVTGDIFITRDHIGIIPLYWGTDSAGRLYVASEQKCLVDVCTRVDIFPPRMYFHGPPNKMSMGALKQWYHMNWIPEPYNPETEAAVYDRIYNGMYKAVEKMIPCEFPNGFLLSGGLDSSLVAAFARKILGPDHELHTFTIGLENAPDFKFAREVAKYIGSIHHEFVFSVQEGLDAIPQVIKMIEECYLNVRASIPQYLLAKKIASLGFKMVMSGEGSDEAWAGYLYFHHAPNDEEMHQELKDKLSELHYYDCLRTNKAMMASSLEVRVPFLDKDLLDIAMTIPAKMKHPRFITHEGRPMEKGVLRKACDREDLLPQSVLWRQKEQFSDSVGFSWIEGLKRYYTDKETTEHEFNLSFYKKYKYSTSTLFKHERTVASSTPRGAAWLPEGMYSKDPSGRAVLGVHLSSTLQSSTA